MFIVLGLLCLSGNQNGLLADWKHLDTLVMALDSLSFRQIVDLFLSLGKKQLTSPQVRCLQILS